MTLKVHAKRLLGSPTKNAVFLSRYVGSKSHPKRRPDEQSQLVFWGIPTPIQRFCVRRLQDEILAGTHLEAQWNQWVQLWKSSNVFELRNLSLIAMSAPSMKPLRLRHKKDLLQMAHDIDNWAHSDSLSSMLADVLEEDPKLWTQYKKWNGSKNPWLRRQSLVGIYYYARQRKSLWPADQALALVQARLEDSHFFVQKGLGWTLRELDRVDSKKQRDFVKKNLKLISATAWFATSELYPISLRKSLVAQRRKTS